MWRESGRGRAQVRASARFITYSLSSADTAPYRLIGIERPRAPCIPPPVIITVTFSTETTTTETTTTATTTATAWRWRASCAPVKHYLSGSTEVLVATDCAVTSLSPVVARALRLARAIRRSTAIVRRQRLISIADRAGHNRHCQC